MPDHDRVVLLTLVAELPRADNDNREPDTLGA
jgi:hypothetical protein